MTFYDNRDDIYLWAADEAEEVVGPIVFAGPALVGIADVQFAEWTDDFLEVRITLRAEGGAVVLRGERNAVRTLLENLVIVLAEGEPLTIDEGDEPPPGNPSMN